MDKTVTPAPLIVDILFPFRLRNTVLIGIFPVRAGRTHRRDKFLTHIRQLVRRIVFPKWEAVNGEFPLPQFSFVTCSKLLLASIAALRACGGRRLAVVGDGRGKRKGRTGWSGHALFVLV